MCVCVCVCVCVRIHVPILYDLDALGCTVHFLSDLSQLTDKVLQCVCLCVYKNT